MADATFSSRAILGDRVGGLTTTKSVKGESE